MLKYIFFIIFITQTIYSQTNIIIKHNPITKFCYPGKKITFKVTIITQNCSVSSATLFYRNKGESDFVGIKLTNNSHTNYYAILSNENITLNDIEYFINVKNNFFSNFWCPERTNAINFYSIDITTYFESTANPNQNNLIILPDDVPDDLKFTAIEIPENSIDNNYIFGIENKENSLNNLEPENNTEPVMIYQIYKKSFTNKENFAFLKNIKITLKYFDENNDGIVDNTPYNENDLKVFWFDGIKWRLIESSFDKENNKFQFYSSHTGIFGIFYAPNYQTPKLESEILDFVANPSFSPLKGEIVTFGIKPNITDWTILIYDLKGNLVRSLKTKSWDGKDEFSNILPSGVYIYQIIANNKKIAGIVTLKK